MPRLVIWLSLVWLPTISPALAEDFPYTGHINSDDVYVRSGPGRNYYPTDKLRQGETVEIYRHDPGGWYAIRPPQRSFTWIEAAKLEPGKDGLSQVRDDGTVGRVGSRFNDLRDVIQVRLDRGEAVEVLETTSDGRWCKVSPPSGEFRWVHSKFVDAALEDSRASSDEEESEGSLADDDQESDSEADVNEDQVRLASHEDGEWKSAPQDDSTSEFGEVPNRRPSRSPKANAAAGPRNSVYHLELEISAVLATEPDAWSFADVRSQAEQALEDAQTAIDRGRIRKLLARIDSYEDLKRRHAELRARGTDIERESVARSPVYAAPSGPEYASRYDASGVLLLAPENKPGWPQYAIYDSRGAVTALITPAPGVNLRPYLNKAIGVQGNRGYMPEARMAHVHVQRIDELGGPATLSAGRSSRVFR